MDQPQASVAKQAGAMGVATFFSRIGGLVREQVFAFLFGASDVADAFNIAFRIPNLLRDLFAEGAMSAAFVPQFTRALEKSKETAFRLLLAVLWTLLLGTGVLALIGIIFAPELVSLYASGYKAIFWKYELTVSLTRWMFPFFPLVALAAVAMGALNAMGYFFLPAFAPVLFNLASIFAGLVLCPLVGRYTSLHPIYGMAVGVVLGGFLQFFVQWWKVRRLGLSIFEHGPRGQWSRPWQAPGVKAVLWLIIPGTMGLAATQLSILINSIFATSKGSGAVSWLNYAFRLMQFPIGIFGVSLAAATLPRVTRLLKNKTGEASAQVVSSLRLCLVVNCAAAAGLMGVGLPLVQLLFQHGHFRYFDSMQTAEALWWYALGLPGYAAVKILVPLYYALGTTRIPVISSFAMVVVNTVLNYLMLEVWQMPFWALAAATAVTSTLNAVFLYAWLGRLMPGMPTGRLLRGLGASLFLGAMVAGACTLSTMTVSFAVLHMVKVGGFLRDLTGHIWWIWSAKLILAIGTSTALWLGVGSAMGLPEIRDGWDAITRKLHLRWFRRG